jgi:hypothetical protein
MANATNGNTIYIDTTGDVTTKKNVRVPYVTVSASSANAVLLLSDPDGTNKIDLRVAAAGETQLFDFSEQPLLFPNGIKAETVTNAIATVVYSIGGGS